MIIDFNIAVLALNFFDAKKNVREKRPISESVKSLRSGIKYQIILLIPARVRDRKGLVPMVEATACLASTIGTGANAHPERARPLLTLFSKRKQGALPKHCLN